MTDQIPMDVFELPPVVRAGFVELGAADTLPLSSVVHSRSKDDYIYFTLNGPPEGDDAGFVSIMMHRSPKGRPKFDETVAFFARERKKWVRLPDGVKSTPDVLIPPGVPASWQHEGFPRAGHDMVHTFTSDAYAMLVRYFGPNRMLGNALFKLVNDNLRVVEGRWEAGPLQCTRRPAGEPGAVERPLGDAAAEVAGAVQRAYAYLGLQPGQDAAGKVVQAIRDAVGRITTAAKRVPPAQADALAIDLGCLWGQCLCDAAGWRWCQIAYGGDPPTYAVASPDGAHAVAPTHFLRGQLARRGKKADKTSLLLFNMIAAKNLPPARPLAYLRLG